jgi:hypothetical protein
MQQQRKDQRTRQPDAVAPPSPADAPAPFRLWRVRWWDVRVRQSTPCAENGSFLPKHQPHPFVFRIDAGAILAFLGDKKGNRVQAG